MNVGTVREHHIRLADGAQTTVQQWGESGPLIVGVHGLGSSRRGWARIGERLGDRYRVVAYDQRGHGDNEAKGPMTLERSIADLADVVASLGEAVHALIGHSWGGGVVVAGGRRLDAARVVAIDPMLRVERGVWSAQTMPEYRRQLAQPLDEREASVRRSFAALPEIEIASKLHATRRLAIEPIEALGADNEIDAGCWDLRALVADYPKPLLLALADPRRSVVLDDEREEFRARGGRHVRIEVFVGASHSLQRDAFDRVMPVLEAFLAE
ncbi:MAG: alpha/beta hydrolase [Candidatus Eremiobacteraeota bacterium]|nr:alpha/beta hydrolase [Candidatus Eremiobacteraeota bacterium]